MDAPCKIQGNIHGLLCLIHKINVSRILGTYQTVTRVRRAFLIMIFNDYSQTVNLISAEECFSGIFTTIPCSDKVCPVITVSLFAS